MNKLKDRIYSLRKERNKSQKELASLIGASRHSIGRWESGKTYPDPDSFIELCDYFNVTADYLLGRSDVRFSDPSAVLKEPERSVILDCIDYFIKKSAK